MLVFARRMLKDRYKSLFFYCVGTIGLLEMYVALFPAIKDQSANFSKVIQNFPPELFKAMNMDPALVTFTTMESYLSTEYLSFLWPVIAIILAISLANYISVGEIEKHTSETLFSLPARRSRIFIERYITGIIILAVFCATSVYGVIPLAILHNADFLLENYFTAFVGTFIFTVSCYSLAVLTSVIFNERGRASTVASGVIILMYAIYVISTLQDSVKDLRYFSFFNYFSGGDLLAKNHYPENMFIVLGSFCLFVTVIALVRFCRRDMSV